MSCTHARGCLSELASEAERKSASVCERKGVVGASEREGGEVLRSERGGAGREKDSAMQTRTGTVAEGGVRSDDIDIHNLHKPPDRVLGDLDQQAVASLKAGAIPSGVGVWRSEKSRHKEVR